MHYKSECCHGVSHGQCRCPGRDKVTKIVPCDSRCDAVRLGDIPVPVVLGRDEVRLIRGMLATVSANGSALPPVFQVVKDKLDAAEDAATVAHAQGYTNPQTVWTGKR